jgi:hypothetical protein
MKELSVRQKLDFKEFILIDKCGIYGYCVGIASERFKKTNEYLRGITIVHSIH